MSEESNAPAQKEIVELSVDDLLMAQALEEQNKPPRASKTAVLASIVEFVNSGEPNWKHVEQRYPTMTKVTLKKYIESVPQLVGRVIATKHDTFGLVIVRIS